MADSKLDLEPTPEEPKKLNKKVVGVVVAILIIGIGYLWFGGDSQESKPTTRTEESVNKNKITADDKANRLVNDEKQQEEHDHSHSHSHQLTPQPNPQPQSQPQQQQISPEQQAEMQRRSAELAKKAQEQAQAEQAEKQANNSDIFFSFSSNKGSNTPEQEGTRTLSDMWRESTGQSSNGSANGSYTNSVNNNYNNNSNDGYITVVGSQR
jgi:type IV secretory pathway VirB10-like protein